MSHLIPRIENKTAEEILKEFGCPEIPFDENVTMYYPSILSAMEEYASIKLAEKDKEIESLKTELNSMLRMSEDCAERMHSTAKECESLLKEKDKVIERLKGVINDAELCLSVQLDDAISRSVLSALLQRIRQSLNK